LKPDAVSVGGVVTPSAGPCLGTLVVPRQGLQPMLLNGGSYWSVPDYTCAEKKRDQADAK
jgi:hypothetical protein